MVDQDSLEVCVPEFWPLAGPSLVGTAIETVGPALELLGPGGPEKCFLTHIPSVGRVLVYPRRQNVQHDFGGKG